MLTNEELKEIKDRWQPGNLVGSMSLWGQIILGDIMALIAAYEEKAAEVERLRDWAAREMVNRR